MIDDNAYDEREITFSNGNETRYVARAVRTVTRWDVVIGWATEAERWIVLRWRGEGRWTESDNRHGWEVLAYFQRGSEDGPFTPDQAESLAREGAERIAGYEMRAEALLEKARNHDMDHPRRLLRFLQSELSPGSEHWLLAERAFRLAAPR